MTDISTLINAIKAFEASSAGYAKITATKTSDAQKGAIHNMIIDVDNDGKVSAAELSAHAADVQAHRDIIDRDGDGKVTFEEELKYALDHQQVTRGEIDKFLAIDTNKDGVKSPQEQIAYLVKQMSAKAAAK